MAVISGMAFIRVCVGGVVTTGIQLVKTLTGTLQLRPGHMASKTLHESQYTPCDVANVWEKYVHSWQLYRAPQKSHSYRYLSLSVWHGQEKAIWKSKLGYSVTVFECINYKNYKFIKRSK